jgi:hypothetical protein
VRKENTEGFSMWIIGLMNPNKYVIAMIESLKNKKMETNWEVKKKGYKI